MGDRAKVVFSDGAGYFSPAIYLHWRGHDVLSLLVEAAPRMRHGDPGYSAARFCGVCHDVIDGNRGLGLMDAPPPEAARWSIDAWRDYGPGDSGTFVVNVRTWTVVQYSYDGANATTLAVQPPEE